MHQFLYNFSLLSVIVVFSALSTVVAVSGVSASDSGPPYPAVYVWWYETLHVNGNFNPTTSPTTTRDGLKAICAASINRSLNCSVGTENPVVQSVGSEFGNFATMFYAPTPVYFYNKSDTTTPTKTESLGGTTLFWGQFAAGLTPFSLPPDPFGVGRMFTGSDAHGNLDQTCVGPSGASWSDFTLYQKGSVGSLTTLNLATEPCRSGYPILCACMANHPVAPDFTTFPTDSPSINPTTASSSVAMKFNREIIVAVAISMMMIV